MKKIAVVFHSATGHTAKMAEAVMKGAQSVAGVTVISMPIKGEDIDHGRFKNEAFLAELDTCDGYIFGSPAFMGNVSGQFKCFADALGAHWYTQKWAGKLAAGFTVSAGLSGDKLSTLQYLCVLSAQLGMVWIGLDIVPGNPQNLNRLSSYLGAMGQAGQEPVDQTPNEYDKATGEHLGKRFATYLVATHAKV
jgi:multimeric flavodoxin WrbA